MWLEVLTQSRAFNVLENYLISYFEKGPYLRQTLKNNLTTLNNPKLVFEITASFSVTNIFVPECLNITFFIQI